MKTLKYFTIKNSGIHNKGVFASENIPKNTKIIGYVGKKITKAVSEKRADKNLERSKSNPSHGAVYIFELNKKYDIDGNVSYNLARFINHSCNPNCFTEVTKGHIWIKALKDIKKGEELSYDYGYSIEDWQDHPCKCGSHNCAGFIVDSRQRWRLKNKILELKSL